MRKVSIALSVVALSVLAGAAAPVAAESYTVNMKSGSSFETRYRPRQASWDAAKVVLLTEHGNSIALRKDDIASVIADSENRGFGRVIDNTTLELGFVANDAVDPSTPADPARALADALLRRCRDGRTTTRVSSSSRARRAVACRSVGPAGGGNVVGGLAGDRHLAVGRPPEPPPQ